jgi:hypothetical protein
MKSVALNPIRIAVLSTAAALAPLTLVAQDPMIPPASGNLPNQQQQSPAMQDSSGAPGMTAQMIRDQLARARGIQVPVRKPSAGPGQ